MLHELSDVRHREPAKPAGAAGRSLRVVLWTLWALVVAGAAFLDWRADIVAGGPVDLLGLVIRTLLVGLVAVSIGTAVVALLACMWPARSASRVDPLIVLKEQ